MDTVDLLLHPVRLRIMHALSGGREMTTAEISARLPEVPRVTLYRQVALLVDGGFMEVIGEERVRGAVERRYRLRQDRPTIGADAAAGMSIEDHRRGFAAAIAVLIAEFNAYLDRDVAEPTADGTSYRQSVLWLSLDERAAMTRELLGVLRSATTNRPAPGRTPYLLSPILFPLATTLDSETAR